MKSLTKLLAILAMSVEDVPTQLQSRLEKLVTPIWKPEGLKNISNLADESKAEILVTANADLSGAMLKKLGNLKLIVATGTAYDYIDLDYCKAHGITVCNTPRYTGSSVAEHAMALLLNSNRQICTLDRAVREGITDTSAYLGHELEGKVAGIIGFGDIGSRIARFARCFNMEVKFANRSPKISSEAIQISKEELLESADVIFLSLPLTPETYHFLDTEQFSMMKPTALVINISADELINPEALRTALENKLIAGAALDVIGSTEPYVNMPNLIITPTHGWYTVECIRRRAETWISTIDAYLADRPHNIII